MSNMNLIKLLVPLETVNAAIVALSKFPYEQAQPHIDLIRGQADTQAKNHAEAAALAQQQSTTATEGQPE
jgi:hypothetical protein